MTIAIGLTNALPAGLALTLAVIASRVSTTGIASDQRPWIILFMAAATLGLLGLFVIVELAWLRGTATLPRWARNAWWRDRDIPPLVEMASKSDLGLSARAAVGVIALGLPIVIVGAPIQGMLLGWLLNPAHVLTSQEAVIAAGQLVCLAGWAGYLAYAGRPGSWKQEVGGDGLHGGSD